MDEQMIRAMALQAAATYVASPVVSAAGLSMAEKKMQTPVNSITGLLAVATIFERFITTGERSAQTP